ncbi:hypothetical protein BH20ACI2_BH20ACI2_15060 [soil metagenome]
MNKARIFQISSVALLGSAFYFFWMDNSDYAFFFLVLSACSFLLNIRFQAKARLADLEEQNISKDLER